MNVDVENKLQSYQMLLSKWQSKINLISSNTLEDAWERHFEDSMQVSEYLPANTKVLFDLGSGAGFPGLVLAIMRPEVKVTLIESDQKKCSFLKTVSRETGTPVRVCNERIESVSRETVPDVITARALASLVQLFDYCRPWIEMNPEMTLIFPKGARAAAELKELSSFWRYECNQSISQTDKDAKILAFSNVSLL